MINIIHTKQGKSFKGLVSYLLEGSKGAENPDRVEYTFTRNLATGNPRTAARVMAFTALDQSRLKEAAGIPSTGRKSTSHVLHYTLSWPAGKPVDREEVMEAVDGSLAALGEKAGQKGGRKKDKKGRVAVRDHFATEHQVLAVVHNDSKSVHVHVMVNRVHPGHGVMLPSSRDFLKLSKWAERFEREHGGLVIDSRAIANEARDKGEKVYGKKRVPRNTYELEEDARYGHPEALKLQEAQRNKDAALAKKSAAMRTKRKDGWAALEETHKHRREELRSERERRINAANHEIGERFREKKRLLMAQQRLEVATFEKAEDSLIGKASNALSALVSLKAGANVLWSQGARVAALLDAQERKKRQLDIQEQEAKAKAARLARADEKSAAIKLGLRFKVDRASLIFTHQMEKAVLRAEWSTRDKERKAAWDHYHRGKVKAPLKEPLSHQASAVEERTKEMAKGLERIQKRRAANENDKGRDDRGR